MFDIGFAELLIIAVVALLVIGPDRLPGAIRTGSAWLNRFRRSFQQIKQEVQQELHNDEVLRELRKSGDSLRRETESLRDDLSGLNPAADMRPATPPDTSTGTAKSGSTGGAHADPPSTLERAADDAASSTEGKPPRSHDPS